MDNHIICQKCKTDNLNVDYCVKCGELINIVLKRQLEQKAYLQKAEEKREAQKEYGIERQLNVFLNHPNILIRSFFKFFYSIGMAIYLIATLLAFVVVSLLG
nr:hypothetical protein [uncultured Flavobacterium sp.]